MTSRTPKVSLRVAHERSCSNASQGSLESVGKRAGCTCKTKYFTFYRDAVTGKPVKGMGIDPQTGEIVAVGRIANRQLAERQAERLQTALEDGRIRGEQKRVYSFSEWADKFEREIGPESGIKSSTLRQYVMTAKLARQVFGDRALGSIDNEDLRTFVRLLRQNGNTDASVAKNLRHLGRILQAAEDDGLIVNPVRRFKKSLRLKVPAGTEPFTDVELAQLWQAMSNDPPVYLAIAKAAVVTGSRRGELIGADLDDLSLLEKKLQIRHHYDGAQGLVEPKDGEARTLNLTAPAVRVLEDWLRIRGSEPGPLFPHPEHGGRIDGQRDLAARITRAMEKAGIEKAGENGRDRKPFHALRASFTRVMLEQGRNPAWVQGQLGPQHRRPDDDVYGKWSQAALVAEAESVEADAFPI